ncbi:TRAP transporter substrate-binding protein [Acidovorax sp. Leaf160]|uniref:TRAP transporter substrate-binding protein n=1 Tax=Acidovorax sp. Leaf160 TaxID=1736280 RepID=UPI0006F8FBD8|nr:TRAP transporter substrate-binding protein [Acidovorax sp. Leaf160]KQR43107.1 ABC transporter substrate-binding protein [Acidovorax sp. Leaf160]
MKIVRTIAAAVAAACLAASAMAQTKPLRLGHGIAEEHPLGQGAIQFAKILEKRSGGKLTMKVYAATQLGSEAQMIAAVRGGVQDLVITSTAPVATMIKEYLLFDLPFLLQSEQEADALLDGPVGTKLLALAQPKNMVGLCYWENGFRQVTNSRNEIKDMAGLSGLKLRVMQNPVYIDAFKTLGANAIPMPFTELYTAMESRAIDAEENPIAIIHSNKFYEVQKYVTLTNHAYAPYVVLMAKSTWDKLDAPGREALRDSCAEARDWQRTLSRRMTAELTDKLRKEGMTVTPLAPAEVQKMRARLAPVTERYTTEIGADLVDQAQQQLARSRAAK